MITVIQLDLTSHTLTPRSDIFVTQREIKDKPKLVTG
jgi:hypothetical protein